MVHDKRRNIIKIVKLQHKLDKTDYIASKLAEAIAKDTVFGTNEHVTAMYNKYANEIEQRDKWRDEINELEEQLIS